MTQQQQVISWFIVRNGQQHGPISDQEIQLLIAQGHLKPQDLVWRDGFTGWQPAHLVFPRAQPQPPPPTPIPLITTPSAPNRTPPAAAKEKTVKTTFGEYLITYTTGFVRHVQTITKISSHSSGGGGTIQNGSGYVSAPSVTVTSQVTQRIFVEDETGAETNFDVGESFAVRPGNRVRVGFAGLRGRQSLSGLAQNLDVSSTWQWKISPDFPGYRRLWITLGAAWIPVILIATNFRTLENEFGRRTGENIASYVLQSTLFASTFIIVLIIRRYRQRQNVRKQLLAAMAERP